MKKLFQFTLIFLLGSLSLTAQQLPHAQGEILVKTEKNTSIKEVILDLSRLNGVETGLTFKKNIVKSLDMYALEFDFAQIDENEMLQAVARHDNIFAAQFNHFTKLRLEPNDPQFGDQWQYINTGQGGGTPGADIDMDLAWDITTGGLTANGDTIVCAIVDDGLDMDHVDIVDNLWTNWAEIPGNGIDDDNNGYVDDINGWNAFNSSGTINGGGHGTPVTGIIGAKGNNEIGVAGVNWDVKLMIVQGSSLNEATVLESYGYIYDQRVIYNETNGEEGAFVVSTNASFGIDFGQPEDSPLWCGFYDTLGEAGILNCGATINGNENVDQVGDVPTACPSDYMISVTNMNRNDVKVTGAGFGAETIDLGAFGAETWNIAANNGYGPFGGTSGATPHVTGAIGLLYSAPCSNIADLALADPAAAALEVRSYILGGVDPNESLDGITVTGGRLNVHNSLLMLLENCGPCPPPSSLDATDITDVSANLSWMNNDSILTNELRWREFGAEEWNVVEDATSPYGLTDLLACTTYEFQVLGYCESDTSTYALARTFTTDGCCTAPEELTVEDQGENSFIISWESILAAESYDVRWREQGTEEWNEFPGAVNTNFLLSDLEDCNSYEVQVATVCETETTEYTMSVLITTDCGPCTEAEYCDRPEGNTVDEWIESVSINGTEYVTGNNDGDEFVFGGPVVIDATQALELEMTPAYSGQQFQEVFTVFLDLNADGAFSTDESIYTSASTNTTEFANVDVPVTATNGITRMRIRMVWVQQSGEEPCAGGDAVFGETEDYCVEIINAGLLPCNAVMNLDSVATTTNSIQMAWDANEDAESYMLSYEPTAGGTATEVEVTEPEYTAEGLEFCTEYTFTVEAVCGEGNLSDAVSKDVSTSCLSSNQELPTEADALSLFPNPFTDKLMMEMSLNTSTDILNVEVLNAAGQRVSLQKIGRTGAGTQIIPLEMSTVKAGVYFLRITTDSGTVARRVIKG